MAARRRKRARKAGIGREAPTVAEGTQDHTTGVGARLRRAREARGMSLRQIADQTKISVLSLEAIERDNLKRLPGGIFTRAFVRAYAAAVGLSPEKTLEDFLAQAPETAIETGALPPPEPPAESTPAAPSPLRRFAVPAAVPVLLVVLYAVLAPASNEVDTRDRRPLNADRVKALGIDTPAPVAHAAAEEAGTGLVHAVNDRRGLTVVLNPRRECWLSAVRDGEHISRLLTAGVEVSLEAEREILLKLGDAGAVSITVNGEPIRMLGEPGQVVTARFSPETVGEYLANP